MCYMFDREKVINGIEHHRSGVCGNGCPYCGDSNGCLNSLFGDVMELLKEQEAKQIVRKQCKKEHDDGSIDYFAEWYCPHCNSLILRGFDNPSIKFCYKCGKPILWEMPVKWKVKWE